MIWNNPFNPLYIKFFYLLSSSSEVSEYSDEEEQEGEGAYPAEEFCIPWYMADFPNHLHFAEYGDGVHAGLIDRISQELVAVLDGYVFYKDCVGFRRFLRVQGVHVIIACSLLKDVDRVVMLRAQIDGIYWCALNEPSHMARGWTTVNCKKCKKDNKMFHNEIIFIEHELNEL